MKAVRLGMDHDYTVLAASLWNIANADELTTGQPAKAESSVSRRRRRP
jgi:hypothetical protein